MVKLRVSLLPNVNEKCEICSRYNFEIITHRDQQL